jgi:hypothetical protein
MAAWEAAWRRARSSASRYARHVRPITPHRVGQPGPRGLRGLPNEIRAGGHARKRVCVSRNTPCVLRPGSGCSARVVKWMCILECPVVCPARAPYPVRVPLLCAWRGGGGRRWRCVAGGAVRLCVADVPRQQDPGVHSAVREAEGYRAAAGVECFQWGLRVCAGVRGAKCVAFSLLTQCVAVPQGTLAGLCHPASWG